MNDPALHDGRPNNNTLLFVSNKSHRHRRRALAESAATWTITSKRAPASQRRERCPDVRVAAPERGEPARRCARQRSPDRRIGRAHGVLVLRCIRGDECGAHFIARRRHVVDGGDDDET